MKKTIETKAKKMKPNKEHINRLLEFLYHEVVSASGDGDSFWYTRFYSLDEIEEIIREYNDDHAIGWEVNRSSDNQIDWGIDQEWVIITDSEEIYGNIPNWFQSVIKY